MWLPVEVSEGQFAEELVAEKTGDNSNKRREKMNRPRPNKTFSLRLFRAWHDVWLILAVVELCSSTQLLIFLPLGELL